MTNLESGAVITPNSPRDQDQNTDRTQNQTATNQEPILKDDSFKPDQPAQMPPQAAKTGGGKSKGKMFMLVVLILLLAGGVGYGVYYWQHKKVNDQASQLQSQQQQISDLQSQVKDLQSSNKALEVTQNVVKIPELNIQVNLPTSVQDLVYSTSQDKFANGQSFTSVSFSSKSLMAADANCKPESQPLGIAYKVDGKYPTKPTADNSGGDLVKQFDTYYISYANSGSPCSSDKTASALQTSQSKALEQAIKSLQTIN